MDTRQLREVGRRAGKAAERRQLLETGRASVVARSRHIYLRYALSAAALLVLAASLWLVVSMSLG